MNRLILVIFVVFFQQKVFSGIEAGDTLKVYPTSDFILNGKGDHASWARTSWNSLHQIDAGVTDHATQFKILHSPTGIYVLFKVQRQENYH